MADDPLQTFRNMVPSRTPAAAAKPVPAPALVVNHDADGRQPYEAYEAFDNQVRSTNVELRVHRTGLSHFIAYAHISGLTFNFATGGEISFIGDGNSVIIKGRSLRAIIIAINMHTCGMIQDFNHQKFVQPEPVDPAAPFVESIEVEVLRPTRPGDGAHSKRSEEA